MGGFSKFVAFYDEPARLKISDGIVTIRLRSGDDITEMAMPICVFAKSADRSQRALERYRAGDHVIIIDD